MSGIDNAARTVIAADTLTTTNLASSATYTGPTFDGGEDSEAWPTRVRPLIRHLSATAGRWGYLVLEESSDGTTFLETRRRAIPNDGGYRTYDWPVHLRYHRLKFINGAAAQTGMRLSTTAHRGEGASIDDREVTSYLLTSTLLASGATFTSTVFDLGSNTSINVVRVLAIAAGGAAAANGLRVEWSDDNTTWGYAEAVASPAAGSAGVESKVMGRYMRVVLVNGATAQTALRAIATLVSL